MRPDGIDQDVEARGLDQPAGVTDKGEPRRVAFDARGRGVGLGAGGPFRPHCSRPVAAELPAQYLAELFRRHAVRIEEDPAVEMIGRGSVAGTVHGGGIGGKNGRPRKGQAGLPVHETASSAMTFIDFWPPGGFNRANSSERMIVSTRRPALEAGGQRPTALCALGRKRVWSILIPRSRVSGVSKDEAGKRPLRDAGFACSSG